MFIVGVTMDVKALAKKARTQGGLFEIIRFLFIGGLATLVDLTVTVSLVYLVPTLHENFVTTIAFFVAFFVSYFGHRHVTFQREGSLLKFFGLSFSMLVLRNIIVWLLVTYVMRGLVPIVASMIIVTGITFVCSKLLVFKENKQAPSDQSEDATASAKADAPATADTSANTADAAAAATADVSASANADGAVNSEAPAVASSDVAMKPAEAAESAELVDGASDAKQEDVTGDAKQAEASKA